MSAYSLRTRLVKRIAMPVLLASAITLCIGFIFAWNEIEEVYDVQMVQTAKMLHQISEYEVVTQGNESLTLGYESDVLRHKYENKLAFRVWHGPRLLARSWNTDRFEGIETVPGYSDLEIAGKPWRIFVFVDPQNNLKIEVAQRYAIRYELLGQLMLSLVVPTIAFIPMIILIVFAGVRKSLKPVVRASDDVDRRGGDDFSPILMEDLPAEITPLTQAMNNLFKRIEESFRREKEFTDHAAHELRTPLAAMKTQTQVLLKKAGNKPELKEGLENLQMSIDRSTRLVEQLLSLARLQNEHFPLRRISLSSCLLESVSEARKFAQEKAQEIQCDIADYVSINGDENAVAILLRNLLDNAVKYAPTGSVITVTLEQTGIMRIADRGPGLSAQDKVRVFERFVRADKTGQSGSGLGLPIAQWIAKAHGTGIMLSDNVPSGLIASVHWCVE